MSVSKKSKWVHAAIVAGASSLTDLALQLQSLFTSGKDISVSRIVIAGVVVGGIAKFGGQLLANYAANKIKEEAKNESGDVGEGTPSR